MSLRARRLYARTTRTESFGSVTHLKKPFGYTVPPLANGTRLTISPPNFFFHVGGDVGFASDSTVCLFDELLSTDGGAPFHAYYRTGFLTFGYPERCKRSLRVSLSAHMGGNNLTLEIEGETSKHTRAKKGALHSFPELFDYRMAIGRTRFVRATVWDSGEERSRIYRLALYANL